MQPVSAHSLSVDEVLRSLGTSREGLSDEEASERLRRFGPNELRRERRISPLRIFLQQFCNVLIAILIAVVLVSAFMGDVLGASTALAIVLLCALMGFFEEYRAERALEALKKLTVPTSRVIRGGRERLIPTRELVPGDILVLESGDRVGADARVIECWSLRTDEAPLTGESVPVDKSVDPLPEDTAVPDRTNMVFAGTTVVYGRGKAVVVSTGSRTELGRIAQMLQEVEEEATPLEKRMAEIGRWLAAICLAVCGSVAFVGYIRGYGLIDMLLWGLSLAVAAVPEALPAIVTGCLAIGVHIMAKQNAIVRKLPAVETLGCTAIICADKTGTLTKGEMTARRIYAGGEFFELTGTGYAPEGEFLCRGRKVDPAQDPDLPLLLKVSALCNNARLERAGFWRVVGDPTEGALLVAAAKAGLWKDRLDEENPRVGEIPFSSERKMMSTVHRTSEGWLACVKGAPEVVLERCSRVRKRGREARLTSEEAKAILSINEEMAEGALRVLAIAYKRLPEGAEISEDVVERDLVFLGLVGSIDPPRPEAIEAVRLCRKAGIRPIMLTGDHKLTAVAVAREMGILEPGSEVLTGYELDRMSDEELEKAIDKVSVYARIWPAQKVRIVKAWKKRGKVIAMTGDGVNDAPALRLADIGVAMGITGTEVAKEASDMVLADDNFATIVSAVKEGRRIYDNIKKYLVYLLSCNIAEIAFVSLALFLGLPLPLNYLQILWVNLVTDGPPAVALGVDPPDPDVMVRPPRDPREGVFTRRVKALLAGISAIITAGLFLIFRHYLTSASLAKAMTVAFTAMVLFELFNAFNCRSEKYSIFKVGPFSNRALVLAVAASFALQLLAIYSPVGAALGTVWLDAYDWALILLTCSSVLVLVELGKALAKP